jgi:hypothetical protein
MDGAGVGRLFEASEAPSVVSSYFFTSNFNINYLFTDGAGVGRLFEATGAPSIVNFCFSLLRKGAKMVLVGKYINTVHWKKKLPIFPSPAVSDIPAGDGKTGKLFFYSVMYLTKYLFIPF